MTEPQAASTFISPRLVAGLLIVSALSLLTFLVLSAYAPELRAEKSDDANVLSKSAVGYAGLRFMLEDAGYYTTLSRSPFACDECSLVVLTPALFSAPADVEKLARPGPRLIILPKWLTAGDPAHSGWAMKVDAYGPGALENLLSTLAKGTKIAQGKAKQKVRLTASDPRFTAAVPKAELSIDQLQTISGKEIEAKISDASGHAVLAQIRGSQIYVLADPDLINNMGLHDRATASLSYSVVDLLQVGDGTLQFDITLNGFRNSPDLLRQVFSPPFLGATLCAILAAAFIAFHALNRFGSPRQPDRVFAFGKRALADNTAAVIRLMRREPQMATRYAQAMLNQIAAQTGVPREKLSEPERMREVEKRRDTEFGFAELNEEARRVRDTHGLVRVAEKLYRWRRGILNEHR